MGKTYAYMRSAQVDTRGQRIEIDDFCEENEVAIESYFIDLHTSGDTPFAQRGSGRQLLAVLKPGDQVVVGDYSRLSRDPVLLSQILGEFVYRQVNVQVCDTPPSSEDDENP